MTPLWPWHQAGEAGPGVGIGRGDPVGARQWLDCQLVDDADAADARSSLLGLVDGTEACRLDDAQVKQLLATALVEGRLRAGVAAAPVLMPLGQVFKPAPAAPPPAAASSPRPAPAAAPAPAAETLFAPDLDTPAMVATLRAAARDGVPFCEECARAALNKATAQAA